MDPIQCGQFIQQLRKERRLTQTELADLLQVTNKAISRWETGEGFPDVMILPKLSSMLGVTVYDKRIRYILYKFLSALEEGIRGYISNHYNSMDKIKSLSMCFYANKVDTESINNACFQAKYVSHVRKVL